MRAPTATSNEVVVTTEAAAGVCSPTSWRRISLFTLYLPPRYNRHFAEHLILGMRQPSLFLDSSSTLFFLDFTHTLCKAPLWALENTGGEQVYPVLSVARKSNIT